MAFTSVAECWLQLHELTGGCMSAGAVIAREMEAPVPSGGKAGRRAAQTEAACDVVLLGEPCHLQVLPRAAVAIRAYRGDPALPAYSACKDMSRGAATLSLLPVGFMYCNGAGEKQGGPLNAE